MVASVSHPYPGGIISAGIPKFTSLFEPMPGYDPGTYGLRNTPNTMCRVVTSCEKP